MQWEADAPNAGFSEAPAERLYLPIDPRPDRPSVAGQWADPDSLLHTVRRLITLRRKHAGLGAAGSIAFRSTTYPTVYVRDGRYLVAVNLRADPARYDGPEPAGWVTLLSHGCENGPGGIRLDGYGFGVFADSAQ